jgi:hypothetical protein
MTVVSLDQLSRDMQPFARRLVEQVGLVQQAQDRSLNSGDLLFYLSETSMPMAAFLRKHGLFMDEDGLHFDLTQFRIIRDLADKVIAEYEAGHLNGVWKNSIFPEKTTPTVMAVMF